MYEDCRNCKWAKPDMVFASFFLGRPTDTSWRYAMCERPGVRPSTFCLIERQNDLMLQWWIARYLEENPDAVLPDACGMEAKYFEERKK
jgi:hypothetical protein